MIPDDACGHRGLWCVIAGLTGAHDGAGDSCNAICGRQARAADGEITIGDAINLAILEEMLRDPMTTIHAEDLQV